LELSDTTTNGSVEVTRLVSDLSAVFDAGLDEEEINHRANFHLMAFIGRVAVGDDAYRSLEEVVPVLFEGRDAMQKMLVEGRAQLTRVRLLTELDDLIAATRKLRFLSDNTLKS